MLEEMLLFLLTILAIIFIFSCCCLGTYSLITFFKVCINKRKEENKDLKNEDIKNGK